MTLRRKRDLRHCAPSSMHFSLLFAREWYAFTVPMGMFSICAISFSLFPVATAAACFLAVVIGFVNPVVAKAYSSIPLIGNIFAYLYDTGDSEIPFAQVGEAAVPVEQGGQADAGQGQTEAAAVAMDMAAVLQCFLVCLLLSLLCPSATASMITLSSSMGTSIGTGGRRAGTDGRRAGTDGLGGRRAGGSGGFGEPGGRRGVAGGGGGPGGDIPPRSFRFWQSPQKYVGL